MFRPVDTKVPAEVEEQVQSIYRGCCGDADPGFVARAFGWAAQCFSGKYEGYQAIDAQYHDFEHTLQGTLCLMRLLHGRHQTKAVPVLSTRWFELGLLAILFHDTGYLKRHGDNEGTGAKYTLVHVGRSAQFAKQFLCRQGFGEKELVAVANMIRCTGVSADVAHIAFQSPEERLVGYALATSDLLGQMAAPDYVEKLPVLFLEFAEAAEHDGDPQSRLHAFKSPEDLLRNSHAFWKDYVLPRIERDFQKLYLYLSTPYPDGPNHYLIQIERNMERLDRMLAAKS